MTMKELSGALRECGPSSESHVAVIVRREIDNRGREVQTSPAVDHHRNRNHRGVCGDRRILLPKVVGLLTPKLY